jgi:hypothetical protein
MLAFDALIGNNDRHPANWGVIVSVEQRIPPRFSPIYDSARCLCWNLSETYLAKMARNPPTLAAYVRGSSPLIGWDGREMVNHFELVTLIARHYPQYGKHLRKYLHTEAVEQAVNVINNEFALLMTDLRRQIIAQCLRSRHSLYCEAIASNGA